MATIKTQLVSGLRRVITKLIEGQRRVSCSCCEECCMYPASRLWFSDSPAPEGFYVFEDLPDEIIVLGLASNTSNGVPVPITLPKVSAPPILEDGEATIYLNLTDGTLQPDQSIDPIKIIYTTNVGEGPLWQGRTDDTFIGGFECLVDPGSVEDNFADSYTVTTNQATGVVSRQSLCVWTGVDDLGCSLVLRYEDRAEPPQSGSQYKWTVSFSAGGLTPCAQTAIAVKTPNQNAPVGNYDYAGVSVA